MTDTVTISKKKLSQLQKDVRELNALYAAGVDNWSGFDSAMELICGDIDEDEDGTEE